MLDRPGRMIVICYSCAMSKGSPGKRSKELFGARCARCGDPLIYGDSKRTAFHAVCPRCCPVRLAQLLLAASLRVAFALAGLEYAIRAFDADETRDIRPKPREVAAALDALRVELAVASSR